MMPNPRRLYFRSAVLAFALAVLALAGPARAASVDSAQFCTGTDGFEFNVLVSGTSATDFILRFAADNQVFTSPGETFGVNFDASGAVTLREPTVTTSGAPPFDRWQDGPITSSSIVPLGNDQYLVSGRIAPGTQPFDAGNSVASVGFRTSASTAIIGAQIIRGCAGDSAVGPDGGPDLQLTGPQGETITRTIFVTGSDFPISVFSEIGSVAPNELTGPGPVVYTLAIAADEPVDSVIEDGIFLLDTQENFSEVLVSVTVVEPGGGPGPPDTPLPPADVIGSLELTGSTATTVSAEFAVDGVFPIDLTAVEGTVEPVRLLEAGNATYSLTISEDLEPGATVEDTITLTDVDGISRIIGVTVQVTAEQDLAGIALLAPNERSLAQLFDDLCPRLERDEADEDLLSLCSRLRDPDNTDEQVAAALRAINPEEILAATTSALRLTRVQHGNLSQRINAVRAGASGRGPETRGAGVDVSGLNLQIAGQTISGAVLVSALDGLLGGGASADEPFIGGDDFGRWGVFINGSIGFGDQSGTANAAGFDFSSQGITAGVDYRLRDNAFLGVAVGFAGVDVDFDDRGGKMDIASWNLSLFGTYFLEDKFYLDGLLNYGRTEYDSVRNIRFTDAQGDVDRTARGSTRGTQRSMSVASGYDFNYGAWTIGPHIGTDLVDSDISTLRERGAGAYDMIVGSQKSRSWTLNAGGHASYAWAMKWGVLIPHVTADFVRELETGRDTVLVRLAADPFNSDPSNPSPSVILQADRPDPSYFVFSAGTSAQFIYGISGFVNYQQMTGMSNFKMSQINVGLRFERQF